MDFGFMLDLEHADFHKPLVSDRAPPKAISMIISTSHKSHVRDFDGSSYVYPST